MQRKLHQSFKYLLAGILLILIVPLAALIVFAAPMDQTTAACAAEHTVVAGDMLSTIAETYLGDKTAFAAIMEATNRQHAVDNTFANITDAGAIEIGWKLCVPAGAETPAETTMETPVETGLVAPGDGWSPGAFVAGAFPPPFPVDSRHDDAWFSEDCQTCHEQQIDDAPEIPHDIWTPNCRSCHVPGTQALESAAAEWAPAFATGAFPSPFPVDNLHEDAWFNTECQDCHEQQIDGATEIPHDVWTQNCRSCHVPQIQEFQ